MTQGIGAAISLTSGGARASVRSGLRSTRLSRGPPLLAHGMRSRPSFNSPRRGGGRLARWSAGQRSPLRRLGGSLSEEAHSHKERPAREEGVASEAVSFRIADPVSGFAPGPGGAHWRQRPDQ
ncbi:hypothetical protein DF3PA_30025 [Candidatus Defluviicoccus seviourii]|uniref:Uncharacterized protein n=1 Tax=Candidatus Defluviicoccus seviourii TaxID=2565273 RepID=A0A564WE68_9PROT|nr:hypothetical protein DF3PA_30025 [Candidatus Defluviicoccus seviourii]